MRIVSITEKLILIFLSIGLFTIIIVGTLSYYYSKNALLDRTFEQLLSVRVTKKARVENFINDRISDVKQALQSGQIKNVLNHLKAANPDKAKINSELNSEYLRNGNYFSRLIVINSNANTFYKNFNQTTVNDSIYQSINEYKEAKAKFTANKNIIISDYNIDKLTGEYILTISAIVKENSLKTSGIIKLEIKSDIIDRIMFEKDASGGLGNTGESYLVGDDSIMRSSSRFVKNSINKIKVKSNAFKRAQKGEVGIAIIKDYRGIDVLSSFSPLNLNSLKWYIFAEIDYKEAMIPIYKLRYKIILISLIISVILFISAIMISKLVTKPIIKLNKAADAIGKGDFEIKLNITSKDEIGGLASSFNIMVDKLKNFTAERLQSMIDGQELERKRLSRELHDGLGQSLIALKMKLESVSDADINELLKINTETKEGIDNIINEIRRISNNLLPAVLDKLGIINALKSLCNDIRDNSGLNICFENDLNTIKFSDLQKMYIYRIVQEALNNIVKHSSATEAKVILKHTDKGLLLNISDNGKGFDIEKIIKHSSGGLVNMRERTTLLKGSFKIDSDTKGTNINISLPL
ncbi:MAG: HAMP domain-containing protein [Bacteroidales bacterium]|nr:HAMP domain-containing protein [Bacteroidales bacterium]